MVASTSFFPHAVFFPNLTNNNYIAREAFSIRVPSVGLVDSFENPNELFLPIPGNSKSIKPVYFFYLLLVVSVYRAKLISAGGFLFKVRDRVWDCYKHIDFIQMFRRGGERFRYNRKYKKLFWYQL